MSTSLPGDAAEHAAIRAGAPVCGRLPQHGLLRFAGPDAASFLQGQLSNDVRPLSEGMPVLAAYSSPQGRVVAVLHLLPHSSGVIAVLPREIVLPTLERMRKYVLRAKVQIQDLSDEFTVAGWHGTEPLAGGLALPDAAKRYAERDGVGIARVASGATRHWVIGNARDLAGSLATDSAETARLAEHDWRLADIRAGLPQVYAATREMFVAQMLNLDLLDGISFTKGCFTGQEIIARTQHLGRIKRRLFRLRLPAGTWAIGQAVHLSDGRSGRLTELAQTGAEFEALAVLSLEANEAASSDSGAASSATASSAPAAGTLVEATQLPLPYSLAALS